MPVKSISLLLQSSSGQLTVGLTQDGQILFDSCEYPSLSSSRNVRDHISLASEKIGSLANRIERVYVDIGPGSLGATRSAVAFANALAFAKGIEVHGVHAFELIGREFQEGTAKPVVCIRNAARPNFYLGFYEGGKLSHCSLANKEEALTNIELHRKNASFAGRFSFVEEETNSGFVAPTSLGNHASMSTFLSVIESQNYPSAASLSRVFPITGG